MAFPFLECPVFNCILDVSSKASAVAVLIVTYTVSVAADSNAGYSLKEIISI